MNKWKINRDGNIDRQRKNKIYINRQKDNIGRIRLKIYIDKRYSKIEKDIAQHFKYNGACLSSTPPFLCRQIIVPFSNSMISTNQETGL